MRSLTPGIPLIAAGLLTAGLLAPVGAAAATPAAGAEVCAGVPLRSCMPYGRTTG